MDLLRGELQSANAYYAQRLEALKADKDAVNWTSYFTFRLLKLLFRPHTALSADRARPTPFERSTEQVRVKIMT